MINDIIMYIQGVKNNLSHIMSCHLVIPGDSILLWPSKKRDSATASLATCFLYGLEKYNGNLILKSITSLLHNLLQFLGWQQ